MGVVQCCDNDNQQPETRHARDTMSVKRDINKMETQAVNEAATEVTAETENTPNEPPATVNIIQNAVNQSDEKVRIQYF